MLMEQISKSLQHTKEEEPMPVYGPRKAMKRHQEDEAEGMSSDEHGKPDIQSLTMYAPAYSRADKLARVRQVTEGTDKLLKHV